MYLRSDIRFKLTHIGETRHFVGLESLEQREGGLGSSHGLRITKRKFYLPLVIATKYFVNESGLQLLNSNYAANIEWLDN